MSDLAVWLEQELQMRGWKPADLARQADIGYATVSRILNEHSTPSPEVCVAIAKALDLDPVVVFQKAGLLPPSREEARANDPVLDQSWRILTDLGPRDRIAALRLLKGLSLTRQEFAKVGEDEAQVEAAPRPLGVIDQMALEIAEGLKQLPEEDARKVLDFMNLIQRGLSVTRREKPTPTPATATPAATS